MEKFGAISTPVPGASASQPRSVSSRRVVEAGRADDGVDAVAHAELEVVHHHVGMGEVDDRLRRRRRPGPRWLSSASTRATSSRSSAASTARHTSAPTRPRAPRTPTASRRDVGSVGLVSLTAPTWPSSPPAFWQSVGPWQQQTIPPGSDGPSRSWTSSPSDHVLEIGCGPGAGAELICSRLETGKLFAIDRSESGVDRTKRRNAQPRGVRPAHRAPDRPGHPPGAGEAAEQGLRLQRQPVLGARRADEIALLHERLLPGGAVHLFYEANRAELVPTIVQKASANLSRAASGCRWWSRRRRPSSGSSDGVEDISLWSVYIR